MNFFSPGKYFSLILITLFLLWHFLQNNEKYLKRKTKELVQFASFPSPLPELKALSRINKITAFLHFDVFLKAEDQGRKWTAKNLQEVKSFLFPYFLQSQNAEWEAEDLTVKLDKPNKDIQTASVFLTVKGHFNSKPLQCKAHLKWKNKKKWLINRIQVFSCLSLAPL